MEDIHVQQWDEEKFFSSRNEWNDLIDRSSADPLFLSWEWQSSWWHFFSDEKMKLRLYVATTSDGQLVGIAPLYSTKLSLKNVIKTTRLQLIGHFWRGKSTMPGELLSLIIDSSNSKNIIQAICTHIHSLKYWDELVIPFLNNQSETYQLLSDENLLPGCYLRHAEQYKSYYLNIKGQFQDYTKNLGKNTRLKLLNRRKNLQQIGEVTYKRMLAGNIDEQFALLNQLHKKRWGKTIFENKRLEFNKTVANLMAEKNNLNFSVIALNDQPISIQYNYVINQHNYNIQAGFEENLHNKISLGYLHFGYEIEASFTEHYTAYDFLSGEGKNTQYKERLTNDYLQMVDLQIIRKPLLKILYKSYSLFNPNASW